MTTFLISEVTDCQKECGCTDGTFKGTDSKQYNYSITIDDPETVGIKDSCGRFIPFDTSDLPALILVLAKINKYVQTMGFAERVLYGEMVSGASIQPD